MGLHKHHPTTTILTYRQYLTFQGFYRVKARANDMTMEDVFVKCILHVAQWLKDRSDYEDYDSDMSFLPYYLSVEEYKVFEEILFGDEYKISQRANRTHDVSIFASKTEKEWTVRVVEPDNARETVDYPGRVFITNIAVKNRDDSVFVAIKTVCKEPSNNVSEASAFRPACLYYIYEDEDLEMYEGGIEVDDYPITGDPICLSTTSKTSCRNLYDNLINMSERQMPIILCPTIEDEAFMQKVFDLANRVSGSAYIIYEETKKDYAKLLYDYMKNCFLGEIIKNSFIYLPPINATEFMIPDDIDKVPSRQILYYKCFLDGRKETWSAFDTDDKGIRDLELRIRTHTVNRDGIKRGPKYEYGDTHFYEELIDKHYKNIEDTVGPDILENIEEQLDFFAKESDFLPEAEREKYDKKISELSKTIIENQEKEDGLKRELNKRSNIITEWQEKYRNLKTIYNELYSKYSEYFPAEQDGIIEEESTSVTLLDSYMRATEDQWNEIFPKKNDEVVEWIRQKYSSTIIIHNDAEKAFDKKATSHLDIEKFCEAFGYLDAYVRFRNGTLSPKILSAIEDKTPFKVTPLTLHGEAKDYPAYFIDIREGDYYQRGVICDLHIKYGTNGRGIFRIYFAYVKELQKAVVGSMPDHLSTGEKDNWGNRKNKV